MTLKIPATLDDLARHSGKAELVDGEIVPMAPTGDAPGTAGDEIYYSLRQFVDRTRLGHAVSDNKTLSGRPSSPPDAQPRCGILHRPPNRDEVLR